MRHDSLTKDVIEGDVEGYIGRRRPRMVHETNHDRHKKE